MRAYLLIIMLIPTLLFSQSINITSPRGGWSSERIVDVQGETDLDVKFVTLIFNKIPLRLPVKNGQFSRSLVPGPGQNSILAEAVTEDQVFTDSVEFYSKAPYKALKIILMWDTDNTDVDMHVIEPNGEECYYGYKNTTTGGSLDVDIVDGYGPEIYTRSTPLKGEYTIRARYYSDNGYPQSMVTVYVVIDEGTEYEKIITRETMLTKTGETVEIATVTVD